MSWASMMLHLPYEGEHTLESLSSATGIPPRALAALLREYDWVEKKPHRGQRTWSRGPAKSVYATFKASNSDTKTIGNGFYVGPADQRKMGLDGVFGESQPDYVFESGIAHKDLASGFKHHIGPLPSRVLIDSDNHFPIEDPGFQAAKIAFARDWKPDLWVNAGDQYDVYSISSYAKDPDRMFSGKFTLQQEFDSARDYWKAVDEIAANVVLLQGNHESRIQRHLAANPGLYDLGALELKRMADLPSKVRVLDYGDIYRVGNLNIEHGDAVGNGKSCKYPTQTYLGGSRGTCSAVFGHWHRAFAQYTTVYTDEGPKEVVAISQGHGSDAKKAGYIKMPTWNLGFTAVEFYNENGKPRFTAYPIVAAQGRFSYGGKVYDGRLWQ